MLLVEIRSAGRFPASSETGAGRAQQALALNRSAVGRGLGSGMGKAVTPDVLVGVTAFPRRG